MPTPKSFRTSEHTRSVVEAVESFFTRHSCPAIATHGTLAKNLRSVRQRGLVFRRSKSGYVEPAGNYYRIPRNDILHGLVQKGRAAVFSQFVSTIESNLNFAVWRALGTQRIRVQVPLSYFGIVVGRAYERLEDDQFPKPISPEFLSIGIGIKKEDVLLTLKLSHQDIADLIKKFPALRRGILYSREADASTMQRQSFLLKQIAKKFASKIINELLRPAS